MKRGTTVALESLTCETLNDSVYFYVENPLLLFTCGTTFINSAKPHVGTTWFVLYGKQSV